MDPLLPRLSSVTVTLEYANTATGSCNGTKVLRDAEVSCLSESPESRALHMRGWLAGRARGREPAHLVLPLPASVSSLVLIASHAAEGKVTIGNAALGITFDHLEFEKKLIVFRDKSGAVVTRSY